MEFSEKIPEGKAIIPGYESLFDRVVLAGDEERENLKQRYAEANWTLWDSATIADLYSAVQKVINLPPADDEMTMRSNLLELAFAMNSIPLTDRRAEVEQAIEYIEHRVIPRFNTLVGGPQPKI